MTFKITCIHLIEQTAYDKLYTDTPKDYNWCEIKDKWISKCPTSCSDYDYEKEMYDFGRVE